MFDSSPADAPPRKQMSEILRYFAISFEGKQLM